MINKNILKTIANLATVFGFKDVYNNYDNVLVFKDPIGYFTLYVRPKHVDYGEKQVGINTQGMTLLNSCGALLNEFDWSSCEDDVILVTIDSLSSYINSPTFKNPIFIAFLKKVALINGN